MFSIFAKPSMVRLLAFISVALCGFLFSSAQAQNLADAQRLMKQGKTAQALEQAEAYIAKNPKSPQGRFLKGVILTDMGKSAEAIAVFRKMTEDFPELPEPYNNLAVLYAQQKQYDQARMALEMAIKTHPSYSTAHENLGDLYAKLASQAYGKALQIDSSSASTQTKLSMITDLISAPPGKSDKPVVVASTKPDVDAAPKPQVLPVKPETTIEKTPEPAPKVPVRPVQPVADKPVEKPSTQMAVPPQDKPASSGATSASSADTVAQVNQTLRDWASAWAKKDVKAYLGFYAKNFATPEGTSRKAWEAERRKRIDRPGKLEVTLNNIKVDVSGDKATVKFRQRYVSPSFKGNTNKTLVFEKNGNRWQIVQEMTN